LRDIATGRGVTLRDLEARMPYGRSAISEYINGEQRPPWKFVSAFLDACLGDDQHGRETLERKVRPLWEAAAPDRAHRRAGLVVSGSPKAPAELAEWMSALREAANSQELVSRLQLSVSRHQAIVSGLLEMMSRLRSAAEALAAERDELRKQIQDRVALAEELLQVRIQLEDTQRRLDAAQRLQAGTSLRLQEALRQYAEAERLRHEATAQAISARQQLAQLEQSAAIIVVDKVASTKTSDVEGASLMDGADQALASRILHRVDDALNEEAANLDDVRSEVHRPAIALSSGQTPANSVTSPDNATVVAIQPEMVC
jgi:hypothetical protein